MVNDDLHEALVVIFGEVRRAWTDAAPRPSQKEAIDERLGHVYLMVKDIKRIESEPERTQRLDEIMEYIRGDK
jgi:hypothetical protein